MDAPVAKTVTVDYVPKPKQCEFHQSDADELLFGGAKSPGKSCALVMEAAAYAMEHPRSSPHLFRESYDDLEANLITEWKKRIPSEAYRYNESKHEAYLGNGSVVKFRYVSSLDDAKKYQGRSIPWIGVDELTKHDEPTIQELLSCNRSAEGFPVRARFTSNPGGKGHKWVKERFIARTKYGKERYRDDVTGNIVQFIPATVYDGVLVEHDPAYIKRLENLPESERQAYLYGNWDIFEGQFFSGYFGIHNKCAPFCISDERDNSRLIASLDHGITHNTSFGLFYLPDDGTIYRMFTYSNNGHTTRWHADNVVEILESCRFSNYMPPCEVYYDYAMDTKHRLNEHVYRSDLDEYIDAFAEKEWNTTFIPANKRKPDGCSMMKSVFADTKGEPIFRYFVGLNDAMEKSVDEVMTDKLNTEIYAKMEGDDETDELRYGIMGAMAKRAVRHINTDTDKPFIVPRRDVGARVGRGLR